MPSIGCYITTIPKTQTVIWVLIIGLFFSCKSTYTAYHYQQLERITIGNGLTFHPKEELVLISKPTELKSENGKPFYRIFQLKFKDNQWCCETEVPFSSEFTDYHPVFSPDGKWLYFNSDRPIPNSEKQPEKINIWRIKYNDGIWDKPEYLTAINTENHESYPTISNMGTLYFNSDRSGGKGSMDIYKSENIDGKFLKPILVEQLNSKDSENDMFVDPQVQFIILNRYLFDTKEIELFISYYKNGKWLKPEPLTSINETGVWELTPTLSPDGNYLFIEVNGKIKSFPIHQIKNNQK
ncbi:MAG: hypothetical protein CMC76_07505 [Flavobacteriaceae bacterium]|nr:hypothetical protein [Flavobacteriaceae bacterium]|tara:strand:+ start:2311 stop:3198 length:888 start_codon:yes stop_codon:yes gene_type:complete